MARNLRGSWNGGKGNTGNENEKTERELAEKAVRERDEAAFKQLAAVQGHEIKSLESEQTFIMQEQARDVKPEHDREVAAINARFDRRARDQRRKDNGFWGKFARVFGGHKRQQARMQRIERERSRDVDNRTAKQERNERLRQKSLGDRAERVERDLRETKVRHSGARDEFRQNRERGFDHAVKQEINRSRSQRRGRSL